MKTVIIGNGVTGVSCAVNLRKLDPDAEIVIISRESRMFYSRPALMYIYMGHMKFKDTCVYEPHFFKENRIDLVFDEVTAIDYGDRQLHYKSGGSERYDRLVLAVGSKSNLFGWPGQNLPGVQTFYNLQDLELLEANTKKMGKKSRAVVVGGGLIGVEVAEMLHARKIPVSLVVREERFWNPVLPDDNADLVAEEISRYKNVDLLLGEEVESVSAGPDGRAGSVKLKNNGSVIDCQLVVFCVGVSPAVDLFKDSAVETGRGIRVNKYLETSVEGVYAGGDCAELPAIDEEGGRGRVEQVWYTGRMQGRLIARNICGEQAEYKSATWYNSAKFFELEYQTYGRVSSAAVRPEDEEQFTWRLPGELKSITLAYSKTTRRLLGINVFGIRYDHRTCESWLHDELSVDQVVDRLGEANFDPEFYKKYEPEFQHEFKHHHQPA